MADERKYHDFTIRTAEPTGNSTEVWIDGQKMSGVRQVAFFATAGDLTQVDISFFAQSVNKLEPEPVKPFRTIAARPEKTGE